MPIKPENLRRYPKNWRAISDRIKARAHFCCEGVPGQTCMAAQGQRHPITGSIVVLTVAHLDHQPENCADDNLRALCQRCHNRYDQAHRQAERRADTTDRETESGVVHGE